MAFGHILWQSDNSEIVFLNKTNIYYFFLETAPGKGSCEWVQRGNYLGTREEKSWTTMLQPNSKPIATS
jgi:hypothetical protein